MYGNLHMGMQPTRIIMGRLTVASPFWGSLNLCKEVWRRIYPWDLTLKLFTLFQSGRSAGPCCIGGWASEGLGLRFWDGWTILEVNGIHNDFQWSWWNWWNVSRWWCTGHGHSDEGVTAQYGNPIGRVITLLNTACLELGTSIKDYQGKTLKGCNRFGVLSGLVPRGTSRSGFKRGTKCVDLNHITQAQTCPSCRCSFPIFRQP